MLNFVISDKGVINMKIHYLISTSYSERMNQWYHDEYCQHVGNQETKVPNQPLQSVHIDLRIERQKQNSLNILRRNEFKIRSSQNEKKLKSPFSDTANF